MTPANGNKRRRARTKQQGETSSQPMHQQATPFGQAGRQAAPSRARAFSPGSWRIWARATIRHDPSPSTGHSHSTLGRAEETLARHFHCCRLEANQARSGWRCQTTSARRHMQQTRWGIARTRNERWWATRGTRGGVRHGGAPADRENTCVPPHATRRDSSSSSNAKQTATEGITGVTTTNAKPASTRRHNVQRCRDGTLAPEAGGVTVQLIHAALLIRGQIHQPAHPRCMPYHAMPCHVTSGHLMKTKHSRHIRDLTVCVART